MPVIFYYKSNTPHILTSTTENEHFRLELIKSKRDVSLDLPG